MKRLTWKPEKNAWLLAEREVSFEEIEQAIAERGLRDTIKNAGRPHQRVLVVEMRGDIWAVPCTIEGDLIVLWTAFVSRKLRKKYGVKK